MKVGIYSEVVSHIVSTNTQPLQYGYKRTKTDGETREVAFYSDSQAALKTKESNTTGEARNQNQQRRRVTLNKATQGGALGRNGDMRFTHDTHSLNNVLTRSLLPNK